MKTNNLMNDMLGIANEDLSKLMKGDCVFINASMFPPLDDEFRVVLEEVKETSEYKHLIVILETQGGLMETVERLVAVMRAHYDEVSFIIPNFAFSAGTVLALSGDNIYMDYYSVLGPIDPQYKAADGQYHSGYGVLKQYHELIKKINNATNQEDCRAELAFLVKNFDPAIIFSLEQAIQHGITLITEWLPKYKFKDWKRTGTDKPKRKVSQQMKKRRADKIAKTLGDASKWHSHGRGISMEHLASDDLKLLINDFGKDAELSSTIRHYHGLAVDYFSTLGMDECVHSSKGIRKVE